MATKKQDNYQNWNIKELQSELTKLIYRQQTNREMMLILHEDLHEIVRISRLVNEDSVKIFLLRQKINNMHKGDSPYGDSDKSFTIPKHR